MVALLELWLPIVLSTATVFILSSLVWSALPHHKTDFRPLPDEDAAIGALRANPPAPGACMLPRAWTHAEAADPETQNKMAEGPVAFIHIVPAGVPTARSLGKKFLQLLVFYLAVSVVVAYVAVTVFRVGHPGSEVFRVTAIVAAMAHGAGVVTGAVYFGTPWRNAWKYIVDGALYGVATGAIFAAMWP